MTGTVIRFPGTSSTMPRADAAIANARALARHVLAYCEDANLIPLALDVLEQSADPSDAAAIEAARPHLQQVLTAHVTAEAASTRDDEMSHTHLSERRNLYLLHRTIAGDEVQVWGPYFSMPKEVRDELSAGDWSTEQGAVQRRDLVAYHNRYELLTDHLLPQMLIHAREAMIIERECPEEELLDLCLLLNDYGDDDDKRVAVEKRLEILERRRERISRAVRPTRRPGLLRLLVGSIVIAFIAYGTAISVAKSGAKTASTLMQSQETGRW